MSIEMVGKRTGSGGSRTTDNLYLDLLKQTLMASLYDESAWEIVSKPSAAQSKMRKHKQRKPWHAAWYAEKWQAMTAQARVSAATPQLSDTVKVRKRPFDAAARAEGRDWPLFGYTMIGAKRLDNLQACVEDVLAKGVPGDLIETGVWRGGSTIFMRAVLKQHEIRDRTVWVADSFQGLPVPVDEDDGADLSDVAQLAVSLEQVKKNFERFGLLDDQVKFLKGWFADTLPNAPIERLAVLRLDGDLYSSTMDALTALYPKVSDCGYVIIDDYGSWPACKRAVDDYIRVNGIKADLKVIDFMAGRKALTGSIMRLDRSGRNRPKTGIAKRERDRLQRTDPFFIQSNVTGWAYFIDAGAER